MKNLLKVLIVATLLSVSLSSFAFAFDSSGNDSILVYNITQNYWYASGSGSYWSTSNSSMRGYMVFDIIYDANGYASDINDVTQFNVYKSGGSKYYYETTPTFDYFGRVSDPNSASGTATWTFVQSGSTSSLGDLTMLRGDVSNRNIGNSDPNEVAPSLEGSQLYYSSEESSYIRSHVCCWRLDNGLTKKYNSQNMNMSEVRADIHSRLQRKGYSND